MKKEFWPMQGEERERKRHLGWHGSSPNSDPKPKPFEKFIISKDVDHRLDKSKKNSQLASSFKITQNWNFFNSKVQTERFINTFRKRDL